MKKKINLENGIEVEINTQDKTATIVKSDHVTGSLLIPRYVTSEGQNYKIISIGYQAFEHSDLESLTFPKDSEVISFEYSIFFSGKIKKLQIPPKLKNINPSWFCSVKGLIDIEISPKNKNFKYIDDKYFVGKSSEDSDTFNVLYYARFDIEDVIIPPQIEIINDCAFYCHPNLKSVVCPKNSKLKRIESTPFFQSTISKLVLPETLEFIDNFAFNSCPNLFEVEISPRNRIFSMIDKTFLVRKSERSKNFDFLVFCRRDLDTVKIPSYIKVINDHAFNYCEKLKTVTFEKDSLLETINRYAFSFNALLSSIIFPPSLNFVDERGIDNNYSLKHVEFLGENIKFKGTNFQCCHEQIIISFPNARKLEFDQNSEFLLKEGAKLKIREGCELVGSGFHNIQDKIQYIKTKQIFTPPIKSEANSNESENKEKEKDKEDKRKRKEKEKIKKGKEMTMERNKTESKKVESSKKTTKVQINHNKNEDEHFHKNRFMRRIRFLENRLKKYEEVTPFDPNIKEEDDDDDDEYDEFNDELNKETIFIDEEDESHQRVLERIGEGATSITYKIIDDRRGEEMCKKVLKSEEGQTTFKDIQNICKEFDILHHFKHPCICECIGINTQEKLNDICTKSSKSSELSGLESESSEFDIKSKKKKKHPTEPEKTTIAIFMKYHPMNLKECLEQDILNNTLKSKLSVEIAFGMSHIHKHGMIHRDLKLENVMVNYIFEAQLIDFGLAYVDEMKTTTFTSKTKGIGTLAYMSPEMANEEDYDNKTDVYSFGVLLFVLFTRRFPKQSMKDKLSNVEIQFPPASSSISKFCINLIKKCMSFNPKKRPTFDQILEDMFNNEFKLADEIDSKLIMRRYRTLNRIHSKK